VREEVKVSGKLRIGVIGCGEIAYSATGKSIQAAHNAEMVTGVDPVEHVARSFGETYDIETTTNLDAVLASPEVDAVVISTPHYTHAPLTIAAAKAGKHVMVEKPIACTLEQADAMIAACKEAGVLLTVNLVTRYDPGAVKAKELIERGAIGTVTAIQFHGAGNKPDSYWSGGYSGRVQTEWRRFKAQSGGGILIMNFVHDIDRLRYVTGLEAVRVYAEYDTFATDVEVEDWITLSMRYENGAIGNLLASSCAKGNESTGDRIYGTAGQIGFGRGVLRVYTDLDVEGLEQGAWNEIELPRVETRQVFIERFAQAVHEGKAPDIPGEEGRKTLEVIYAAYRSGETHQPVPLPME
jgi:UDP-N-acetyl-2-amino-2-deoxyglucuronate dehydrogenase